MASPGQRGAPSCGFTGAHTARRGPRSPATLVVVSVVLSSLASLGVTHMAYAECTTGACVSSACPSGFSGVCCTISGTHLLDNGCSLNFGTQTVTVAGSLKAATNGGSFSVNAANIVVQGLLEAPGGSIGVSPTMNLTVTGQFKTEGSGRINLQAANPSTTDGTLHITAGGSISLQGGEVSADGGTQDCGGTIAITGASITTTSSTIHANASGEGDGGDITLVATSGNVSIGGAINSDSSGDSGTGGDITISASGNITVNAQIQANGTQGGCGGLMEFSAGGTVSVNNNLTVNGNGAVGAGGDISVEAGSFSASSTLRSDGGNGGCGGAIELITFPGGVTFTSTGAVSATAGGGAQNPAGAGGSFDVDAEGNVSISGNVNLTGGGPDSTGGDATIEAGQNATITVASTSTIDTRSTASSGRWDGTITVGPACGVTLPGFLRTRNTALTAKCSNNSSITCVTDADCGLGKCLAGKNFVRYRGTLNATNGRMDADNAPGGNFLQCRCANMKNSICGLPLACQSAPTLTGATITPAATIQPLAMGACLPSCGDGFKDAGEQCDDGNTQNGDCCSATCQFEANGSTCTSDSNPCTNDVCNASGVCTHPNNTAPCNDGLFCNGADTCSGGTCVVHAGNPCTGGPECANTCNEVADNCFVAAGTTCTDDGNVCTNDVCNGSGGCTHPGNSAACDDDVFCNGIDTCSGGSCSIHTGDPCAGGPECMGSCNESAENCFDLSGTACTDDGNVCTDDTCDGVGTCAHSNNTAPCDDGNPCTLNDTCGGGTCQSGPCDVGAACGQACGLDLHCAINEMSQCVCQ
jgi:filamentous hemagglutinin